MQNMYSYCEPSTSMQKGIVGVLDSMYLVLF